MIKSYYRIVNSMVYRVNHTKTAALACLTQL